MHRLYTAAAAALALGLLYVYDPAATAWFPSCPFRALTGLLCPLCGSLRAAHTLLHGHLVEAFLLNPFTFLVGAMLLFRLRVGPNFTGATPELPAFAEGYVASAEARMVRRASGGGKLGLTFAAAIVFTVVRNLP